MGTTSFDVRGPRIHVLGCGGAGSNSVHRLVTSGLRGARTIVVNTDKEHLDRISCDHRVLLGDGAIRGTGGRPEIAERLAAVHEKDVRAAASGADLTFIIAGLGGGTGTAIAPLAARWARMSGAVVVGIATLPFRAERSRSEVARQGLEAFRHACNSLLVLENERLLGWVPNLSVEQAFRVMDHMIGEAIRGVTDALQGPSLIQLDFPDLREILQEGGTSTLLFGEGDARDPEAVVAAALANAMFPSDHSNAKGAIVHMTAGPELPLRSVERVVEGVTRAIHRDARVAFGVRTDPEFEGSLRVMTILTGVSPTAAKDKGDAVPVVD